jgi:signal transduction histidine kinase
MDKLTEFLNKSLDVAEAKADALRLDRAPLDLDELLRTMTDLYEPSMSEKGLRVDFRSAGSVKISADAALMHRMITNLFDNELKHVPPSSTVTVSLRETNGAASLIVEDDGSGFAPEIQSRVFERRFKSKSSNGHGLGLAFVEAVVRAHGGTIEASNRAQGGARLQITLPLLGETQTATAAALALTAR